MRRRPNSVATHSPCRYLDVEVGEERRRRAPAELGVEPRVQPRPVVRLDACAQAATGGACSKHRTAMNHRVLPNSYFAVDDVHGLTDAVATGEGGVGHKGRDLGRSRTLSW